MMMINLKRAIAVSAAVLLVACGGGSSGEAGTSPFGTGSGTGTGTGTGSGTGTGTGSGTSTSSDVTVSVSLLDSTGTALSNISGAQTATATATVLNASGAPVEGIVVTFAEVGPGLLKFSPSAGTALTDSNGQAQVEVSSIDSDAAGATSIKATPADLTVSQSTVKSLQVAAGGSAAVIVPNAINFIQVAPSSSAIVVKGAGGAGRAESATLTFKVVDGSNVPIKGAKVTFSVNPPNDVVLNVPTADSNSDGLVTTTVSSGSSPTSVVVTATADANNAATTQSDTLVVSNGVVLPAGFELVAEKYSLDGRLTGDTTQITAFVRDEFGNPVPAGVAVSFVTNFGSVGTASSGGCSTNASGQCSVPFTVQNPRGTGLATVTGTILKGDGTSVAETLFINMSASGGRLTGYDGSTLLTGLSVSTTSCKSSINVTLSDSQGRAAPAGTEITVVADEDISVSVVDGSPVLDVRAPPFTPTQVRLSVDAAAGGCTANAVTNTLPQTSLMTIKYKTPGGTVDTQSVSVSYSKTP